MVECYKNYFFIIFWLLGNEFGVGVNYVVMIGFICEYDDICLVYYEGNYEFLYIKVSYVDMYSWMYWFIFEMVNLSC